MYKLRLTFYAFLIFMLFGGCYSAQEPAKKQLFSRFTKNRSSPFWTSTELDNSNCFVTDTTKNGSENKMFVYSTWNDDSLHLYFKVMDTDLRAYQKKEDHAQLFLDDMIEVLIDTKNTKDSCWSPGDLVYHVNIMGVKKDDIGNAACLSDADWNGKAQFFVTLKGTLNDTMDIDKGYLLTMSFPWSEIGRRPTTGLTMGINFANGDNDGRGRRLFDWVGAWPMRSPFAFGEIILK